MTTRTCALLAALFLALPALAREPARVEDGVLVVPGPTVTSRLSLTADGALRLTALAVGAQPVALPSSIELDRGPAVTATTAGPYTLSTDAAGVLSVAADGKRLLRVTVQRGKGTELSARLDFDDATTFHGLGQATPEVALRNQRFTLIHTPKYGDQTYLYIPFFFSDSGLAVYANAASGDEVRFEKGRTAILTSRPGRLDLYAWGPAAPAALVSRFYRLSQSRSLLPRWAYGYLQSRYGYRNDEEVRRVVTTASRLRVPLSAIVLDLYWFKRMGDLDWNREAFPDPKGLDDWLEQQGVKLITISEPFIARDSLSWAALDDAGVVARDAKGKTVVFSDWWDFGSAGGGIIDPEAPRAVELLGARYQALARAGVDGYWIDLGEPERTPPAATFGGRWNEAQYHDFFNLAWARLVRGAFEQALPGRRPFILSRSGWTGIAGLGVATWSGDVPASWDGLAAQIPLGLNASLSGLPYWGSDVGGFVGEGGELMPPDPELYLRWQQLGAFTPIDRAHGHGPREPWIYGPQWLQRVRQVITQRATLGPYLYSTAYQVWAEGLPMMRPLFFLEPSEPRWREEDRQFLLGDFLLVAPVLEPLAKSPTHTVRLPRGTWYDAATLARVEGTLTLQVTLETLPLYYREGAIVPMDRAGTESLLLIPGPSPSTFTVFSDDGLTEAYRTGAGEKLLVTLDQKGVSFAGASKARELSLLLPKDFPLGAKLAKTAKPDGPSQVFKVSLRLGETRVDF